MAMGNNIIQFQKRLRFFNFLKDYGEEPQCFDALVKMRWPAGFECPKCGSKTYHHLKQRNTLFQCNVCGTQTLIMAGTIFHSAKLPLSKWFLAIYLMTQRKNSISRLELARQVKDYANTRAMLDSRLVQVMLVRDKEKPLSYKVEMDDTYWGSKKKGKGDRGSTNKLPLIAAVEKNELRHPQHIKIKVMSRFKKREIKHWAEKHLQQCMKVSSDGLPCFREIEEPGHEHKVCVVENSWDPRRTTCFNWVNMILENVKTALAGTFHKFSRIHLARYLATFQCRFNRKFVLQDMITRLAYVFLRTPPMSKRLLILVEKPLVIRQSNELIYYE